MLFDGNLSFEANACCSHYCQRDGSRTADDTLLEVIPTDLYSWASSLTLPLQMWPHTTEKATVL